MSSLVSYTIRDGIATISMDDGKANALSFEMLEQLNEALDLSLSDEAVTVITGRKSVFCGGYDLKIMNRGSAESIELVDEGFQLSLRLLEHPAPVVVACNGHAVAMGALLLLCADFRIGVDGPFKVTTNEVAIGMGMPWAGVEISRQRLTPSHFYRAVNLAEPFGPSDAVDAGFLDQVVAVENLLDSAHEKAVELSRLNRSAYRAVKQRTRKASLDSIRTGHSMDRETNEPRRY